MPEPDVQVFMPWGLTGEEPRDQHYVSAVARLAPGATLRPGRGGAARVARRPRRRSIPQTNEGWSVRLVPLQEDLVGDSGRTLAVLLAAVGAGAARGVRERRPALVWRAASSAGTRPRSGSPWARRAGAWCASS